MWLTQQDLRMPVFAELTPEHEETASKIVEAAFRVHKVLGPGLLERVYERCFVYELEKMGCKTERQVDVSIEYEDLVVDEAFRADVIVDRLVLCELKSVEEMVPLFEAQLLTYLRFSKMRLGFLINFNVPVIKQGKAVYQLEKKS
jgi:GxxExxY protein